MNDITSAWYEGPGEVARRERVRRGLEEEDGSVICLTAAEVAREFGGSFPDRDPVREAAAEVAKELRLRAHAQHQLADGSGLGANPARFWLQKDADGLLALASQLEETLEGESDG